MIDSHLGCVNTDSPRACAGLIEKIIWQGYTSYINRPFRINTEETGGEIPMEDFFKIKENGTDVRTEIIAGATTFLSMVSVLALNPMILSGCGMDSLSVFTATAISAAVATLVMGLFANYPVALASGMGLNAYFAYTVCPMIGTERPWEVALAAVLVEGLLFILLSFTNFRESIVDDMPQNLKVGISVGIGLFIAFAGLKNAGVVIVGEGLLSLGDLTDAAVALSLIGIAVIAVLDQRKVPGAIFWGILITWVLAMIAQAAGWYVPLPEEGVASVFPGFEFTGLRLDYLFAFDFRWIAAHIPQFIVIVFAFFYVDVFDTAATLIGIANKAGFMDKDGKLPRAKQALMSDAIGTCVGACTGTSTVTSFIESATGVAAGGRTGLTAVTTAVLFLVSLVFAPFFTAIPGFATTPALVYVGYLMMSQVKDIRFEGVPMSDIIPAFLAMIMMPFTFSIANGIMFGILSYVVLMIFEGRIREIRPVMWISAAMFMIYVVLG